MFFNEKVTGTESLTMKFPISTPIVSVPKEGEEEDNQPVQFDERQQARITELIKEAQGKAAKEVRAKLKETEDRVAAIMAELEEAKKAATTGTKQERNEASEDVAALQAQLAEIKTAADGLRRENEVLTQKFKEKDNEIKSKDNELLKNRKQWAMQRAAETVGFVDTEAVLALTEKQIRWDGERGTFVVIGDSGAERRNAAMEVMTLEEFYSEYAQKKPYLARGEVKGGVGSTENRGGSKRTPLEKLFGKNMDGKLANELARTDPAEYARRRKEAVAAGLVR